MAASVGLWCSMGGVGGPYPPTDFLWSLGCGTYGWSCAGPDGVSLCLLKVISMSTSCASEATSSFLEPLVGFGFGYVFGLM